MRTTTYSAAYQGAIEDVMTIMYALFDQREAELHAALERGAGVTEARAKFDACAEILINLPRLRSAKMLAAVSNRKHG
jgi:hypothetical protein